MRPLVVLVTGIFVSWVIILGIKNKNPIKDTIPTIEVQNGAGPCSHPDYDVLVAIYNELNGPNWTNSNNWLDTCNVCMWQGVLCDASTQRVINLTLANDNNIAGQIPASIEGLSRLKKLRIRNAKNVTGVIPPSIGNLQDLELLEIIGTNINGAIPFEIGNLTNLRNLNLYQNVLSGAIPTSMGNLQDLESMNLDNNKLTGTIPASLGNLSNLKYLLVRHNELNSSIPAELGNLKNLNALYLNGNSLSGTIPANLGNLSQLYELFLENNQLTGPLPSSLGNLTSLGYLALGRNQLSGPIPSNLASLQSLFYVSLEMNQLSGTIPEEFGYNTQLYDLYLNDNQLSGCIPSSFSNLCDFTIVEIYNNPCLWQGTFFEFCSGAPCSFNDYSLSATNSAICAGSSTSLNTTGGTIFSWSTGETSSSISVSPASHTWYYLTITTSGGCDRHDSILITVNDPPLAISSGTDVTSVGGSDGTAMASATGGLPPYHYDWSTGQSSAMISDLIAGDYTCTITDLNGCRDIIEITINEPACPPPGIHCDDGNPNTYNDSENGKCKCQGIPCPVIIPGLEHTDISCFGENNGSALVNPSGGQTPYTVEWSNGNSVGNISSLTTGDYSVTITDLNGCSTSTNFSIGEPSQLSATITGTDESVPGASDGAIDLTPAGGSAPYSFLWNTGETTEDIFNLSGLNTTYSVTITDGHGCAIARQIMLQTGCYPTGSSCDDRDPNTYDDVEDGNCNCIGTACSIQMNLSKVNISCSGANDGNAWIEVSSVSSSYKITWSTGDTSLSISDLKPGVYEVSVLDPYGCRVLETFRIDEPSQLIAGLNGHHESSQGAADGSVDLTVSGGSFPYYYHWSTGAITQNIDSLKGENMIYSVTVTDSHGCDVTVSTVLNTGCRPPGTACNDQNSQTFNDLEDGECGCLGTPCLNIEYTVDLSHVTCQGEEDGSISVIPTAGIPPYLFLWTNNNKENTITGLSPGIYGLTVTDANGCSNTQLFQINEPDVLHVESTITPPSTNFSDDGLVQIFISGGIEPYSILWENGATSLTRENLTAGIYSFLIIDNSGCTISDTIRLEAACSLSGQICDDGDPATFGDAYREDCKCAGIPCSPLNDILSLGKVYCHGDSTTVSIDSSGLYLKEITWSNGISNAISNRLIAGTYQVRLTQTDGCITDLVFTIDQPNPLDIKLTVMDESYENAKNGSAQVEISGGSGPYQILWSNGETIEDIQNLEGDLTYHITVTDNYGCSDTDSIYIAKFICSSLFSGTISAVTSPVDLCKSIGTIRLESNVEFIPGTEFSLNGVDFQNDPEFLNLVPGIYYPQLRDKSGNCALYLDPLEIVAPDIRNPLVINPDDCNSNNGIIINQNPLLEIGLSTTGPWYKDSISELGNGFFNVYAREPTTGCFFHLGEYRVGSVIAASALTISSSDAPCNQEFGRIEIDPTNEIHQFSLDGGNKWYSNSQTFEVSPGLYEVLVKDADDCVFNFTSINISEAARFIIDDIKTISPSGCDAEDGKIYFQGEGLFSTDYGQTWAVNLSLDNLKVGTYEILYKDSKGTCEDTLKVEMIAEANDLEIFIDTILHPSCPGSSDGFIKIHSNSSDPNTNYSWNNGMTGPELGRLTAGIYFAEISLSPFCSTRSEVELIDPDPINLSLPVDSVLYCQGEPIVIEMNDRNLRYLWFQDNKLLAEGPIITIAMDGDYQLFATDRMNCESVRDFSITYSKEFFAANFLLSAVAEVGQPTQAIEISWPVPEEIIWEIEGGEIAETQLNQATLIFADTGQYEVTLKAFRNGCMSIVSKTIIVQEQGTLTYPNTVQGELIKLILYPNPNLGNFNAFIELPEVSDLQIRIYNGEGLVVYSNHLNDVEILAQNIDLTGTEPGMYALVVQTNYSWKVASFVIE